jgi:sugar/nucleoside kinase (ribokinase family)
VTEAADPVVVVGPASWNTIVQVPRLPAADAQTVFAQDSWTTLGGTSAGKALHLADLGVPVTLNTVVGADAERERIRAALSHPRIRLVAEPVDGRSERHLNLMAGGDRLSVYLSLAPTPAGELPAATRTAIERARHVVLDLSLRTRAAIGPAAASAATVWTDLHNYDGESSFHQPFLDAADVVFLSDDVLPDPRALMTRMLAAGKRLVVCTLGARGALALDGDGWHRADAAPATVVDTNGAGDAFLTGFLAATLAGGTVAGALDAGAAQAVRALGSRHLSPLLDRASQGWAS